VCVCVTYALITKSESIVDDCCYCALFYLKYNIKYAIHIIPTRIPCKRD